MFDVTQIARPCILRQKDYIPGKPVEEVQREYGLTDIIKVASNENPLGTSPLAMTAMIREIQNNVSLYPEGSCHDLAHRLAGLHGLHPEQIFIDNGLDGVITMLGLAFINPGDEVVFGSLSFPAYANITNKMDGRVIPVAMTADYRLDVDAMLAAITPRTKMVFLCNPNNPTGTINTTAEFERLLSAVPEHVLIVSDEAYYDYVDDPAYPQTLPYLSQHPNLIILRTFSKIMGLAGVRIGYAMARADVIKVILKAREPFPVNRVAQAGALASLDDAEFQKQSLALNRAGREMYYRAFDKMGLKYYPSQTNFIFADLGRPAMPVYEAMLRAGIIIRPLASQGVPTGIRITFGTIEQNQRVIDCLGTLLASLPTT